MKRFISIMLATLLVSMCSIFTISAAAKTDSVTLHLVATVAPKAIK